MAFILLELIWLMLPGYAANMAPVIAKKVFPGWNSSISKKLLGSHKTWRGLVSGIAAAVLVSYFQSTLYPLWSLYDYSNWYSWGFFLGFGALAGDSVKSFFKRRAGIKPGAPWIPFDQIDHVVGALALGSIIFFPGWLNALYILLMTFFGHLLVNKISYFLRLRDSPL